MGKTRTVKAAEIEKLQQALGSARGVAFVNFAGLSVKEVTALRRACRAAGVTYLVAKKTLLRLALDRVPHDAAFDARDLPGGVAAVCGMTDEVAAAQTIQGFAKDHPALTFVGGLLPGRAGWQFMTAAEVAAVAALPGRQELLARLVGTLAAPLRGLAGALSGQLRSLVQVLSAISDRGARPPIGP